MRRAALVAGLAVLAAPGAAAANPVDMFGFGARAAAMGGAHTAAADDSSATYYNPARLAGLDAIHIDLGYQLGAPSLQVDGRDLGVDWSHGMTIGLAVPGRVAGKRIAIGAGIFLPDNQLTRTRSLPSSRPRFALYDNRPQRLFLSADAAIELVPGLSIGGGLAYLSSTQGEVALRGLVDLGMAEMSNLELAIDVDLMTIRYPHAGIAWSPTPWLDLGASYRGSFQLDIELQFRIDGDVGSPGMLEVEDGFLDLATSSHDLFQPAELTIGAAARITPRTTVSFDLGWYRWSQFDNPAARIHIDYDLGIFNDRVNLPPERPLPEPYFHDIVVPRLGFEHLAWATPARSLRVRGGYSYEPTPTPEQIGESNFIDNDKHTITAGAGLQLPHLGDIIPRPLDLDAYLGVTLMPGRDHQKLSPIDPVGDYHAGGHVLTAGLTSRWQF